MPERRWVTFVTPEQAQPGRKMRIGPGCRAWTVKERAPGVTPRREQIILWVEGGGIAVQFARRHRWQIEVWA
jgi:hypothetical protein